MASSPTTEDLDCAEIPVGARKRVNVSRKAGQIRERYFINDAIVVLGSVQVVYLRIADWCQIVAGIFHNAVSRYDL